MRAVAVAALALAVSAPAFAEPLPPGSIGLVTGAVSGTGADAKRLGYGFYQFGMQASWQPTTTERKWGWTIRWATMFGTLYNGSAALIDPSLKTVQMDMTLGLRVRPWTTPTRYLTARGGVEVLRLNEPVPPNDQRAFFGAVASVGLDQYAAGLLFDVDVRYGMIDAGPTTVAVLFGVGFTGP